MSEWRPEGWENPWGETLALSPDKQTQYLLDNIYERGADAILTALRAGNESLMKADVSEVARTLLKRMTQRGTWVFIPDEDK